MTVELAQVAAGLPAAASLALVGGFASFREGRRRSALNEAMHELRRPLQVLSLAVPAGSPANAPVQSSLWLVTAALERLDREINGVGLAQAVGEVSIAELVDEAVQRWSKAAAARGTGLKVWCNEFDTRVEGNRFDLAQALDNLLSNAIEHGQGDVRVRWRREGEWVRITVSNLGRLAWGLTPWWRQRRGGRCRHGHGLRVVVRTARRHGGSFALRRTAGGAEASLRLPLRRQLGKR